MKMCKILKKINFEIGVCENGCCFKYRFDGGPMGSMTGYSSTLTKAKRDGIIEVKKYLNLELK